MIESHNFILNTLYRSIVAFKEKERTINGYFCSFLKSILFFY